MASEGPSSDQPQPESQVNGFDFDAYLARLDPLQSYALTSIHKKFPLTMRAAKVHPVPQERDTLTDDLIAADSVLLCYMPPHLNEPESGQSHENRPTSLVSG